MSSDTIHDFIHQSGAKSFPFENRGDRVSGIITAMDMRQQTDMKSGEPKTFSNGDPMMVLVITLQTDLGDGEEDDGTRTVWARRGSYQVVDGHGVAMIPAIRDAIIKAGVKDMEEGGWLAVEYTGDGKRTASGFTAPKLYVAEYRAPKANVSVEDLA